MKRIFLPALITLCCGLIANNSFCQTENQAIQKNDEIIIRTDGDSALKTIIEVDSNIITINGQPLEDYKGNVKVLKRRIMNDDDNFAYSPRKNVRVKTFKITSDRPFLGVLAAKSDKGALINTITKGSSADKAGLKEQDIITKVDDKIITTPEELVRIVRTYKPGNEIKIDYLRNGKKKDMKVVLGKANDEPMALILNDDAQNLNDENFRYKFQDFSQMKKLQDLQNDNLVLFNRDQPKIGLKIQDTEEGNGVKILNVEEGSAAEKAGIQKDDIITEVNGEKVNDVNDVREEMNNSEDKDHYTIKAKRNNTDVNFEVKIPKKLNTADF